MLNYFSMFSGIGGFELGIQRAYMDVSTPSRSEQRRLEQATSSTNVKPERLVVQQPHCIGYSEIDKYAIKVYERQFDGHTNYGDATAINPGQLPNFDLLVGGFPCQAFSVAGKRAGFDDTRGTLFFDIARILKDKRPRHLVLENVKGLLSHDGGRTFSTIIGVLTDLGYSVEWQVLNSKDFGVPQNRERVYIVGHLRDGCGRKVFPLTREVEQNVIPSEPSEQGAQAISTRHLSRNGSLISPLSPTVQATEIPHVIGTIDHGVFKETGDTSLTIPASYYKGHDNHGARPMVKQVGNIYDNLHNSQAGRVYDKEGISPTLDVAAGGNRQPKIVLGGRIRRLTPKECERLQGFPDNWTANGVDHERCMIVPVSDTQRYKMCGNAITVNVVESVIKKLLGHLEM